MFDWLKAIVLAAGALLAFASVVVGIMFFPVFGFFVIVFALVTLFTVIIKEVFWPND